MSIHKYFHKINKIILFEMIELKYVNKDININNEYTNKDFGQALKELMDKKKLSYHQLSYKCELTASYLQQIVTKKVLPPKDSNIEKIANAFGLKPEYFKEYRQRQLYKKLNSENLISENFDIKDFNVPLSDEEINYLKRIIEEHYKKKKNKH